MFVETVSRLVETVLCWFETVLDQVEALSVSKFEGYGGNLERDTSLFS